MDKATFGGLLMALGCIVGCALLEGAHLMGFLQLSAFMLVIGGTVGVSLMSFPLSTAIGIFGITKIAFFEKRIDLNEVIVKLVGFAEKARKEGLLALEVELESVQDPFLKKGLQLVTDGVDMHVTEEILEHDLNFVEERHHVGEAFFSTMGGYSPTLGIIGTVFGLVNALGKLENPEEMGNAIAAAFIATLYGVTFANVVFLPIAAKLKVRSQEEVLVRQVIIEGILSIEVGDNPRITEEKFKVFLSPKKRDEIQAQRAAKAA
jgi:chemotaxis protein MotA